MGLLARVLSKPIFSGATRENVLKKHLGSTRMGELEKANLISTFARWNNRISEVPWAPDHDVR